MADPIPEHLRADCGSCVGLCCVALPFAASADFAFDKAADSPCPHLGDDSRCGIHNELRDRGFPGCTAYDCFGAGQQVTQVQFREVDWRTTPDGGAEMFELFRVMQQIHELLRYLAEALARTDGEPVRGRVRAAYDRLDRCRTAKASSIHALDIDHERRTVGSLLSEVSTLVRASAGGIGADRSGAVLVGARMRNVDRARADFRGAQLIGTDLRDADLRWTDLLGADLRGTRLEGADLRNALFLTQPQIESARGDATTRLPSTVEHPAHW